MKFYSFLKAIKIEPLYESIVLGTEIADIRVEKKFCLATKPNHE